jgi:hypothetical protein
LGRSEQLAHTHRTGRLWWRGLLRRKKTEKA